MPPYWANIGDVSRGWSYTGGSRRGYSGGQRRKISRQGTHVDEAFLNFCVESMIKTKFISIYKYLVDGHGRSLGGCESRCCPRSRTLHHFVHRETSNPEGVCHGLRLGFEPRMSRMKFSDVVSSLLVNTLVSYQVCWNWSVDMAGVLYGSFTPSRKRL